MQDRYWKHAQCVERLVREYKQYGRIIIALDFDNTVFDYHGLGDTYPMIESLLKRAEPYTNVMIFTCRPKKQHEEITEYLNERGIKFDTINEPIITLNGEDSTSKPFYSLLLDDRAGLYSAMYTLQAFITVLESETEDDI